MAREEYMKALIVKYSIECNCHKILRLILYPYKKNKNKNKLVSINNMHKRFVSTAIFILEVLDPKHRVNLHPKHTNTIILKILSDLNFKLTYIIPNSVSA